MDSTLALIAVVALVGGIQSRSSRVLEAMPLLPLSRWDQGLLRMTALASQPLSWVACILVALLAAGLPWLPGLAMLGVFLTWAMAGLALAALRDRLGAVGRASWLRLVPWSLLITLAGCSFRYSAEWARPLLAGWGLLSPLLGGLGLLLLEDPPRRQVVLAWSLHLPSGLPVWFKKDLRLAALHLETWLAAALALEGLRYTLTSPQLHPLALVALPGLLLFLLGETTQNALGLESGSTLRRYLLVGFSGRRLLLSKNLAFLAFALLLCLPALLVAALRGFGASALVALTSGLASALLHCAIGNALSIRFPEKTRPLRFAITGSGAGMVRASLALVLPLTPCGLGFILMRQAPGVAGLGALTCMALAGWLLASVLSGQGERLEAAISQGTLTQALQD